MSRSAFQTGGAHFGHGFPMSPWVLKLLIANFAVALATGMGLLPAAFVNEWLAFSVDAFPTRPWTAVTYMFVHGSFGHIFTNMLALFFFGPPLENHWGGRFFLKFYLVAGLGGALFGFLLYGMVGPVSMVGASGAIFGLLLAFAMNWPDAKIYLYFLFPVPAKWFVAVLGLITLVATFGSSGDGVAHFAHLGGAVTGFVFLRFGERIALALAPTRAGLKRAFFKEKPRHVTVEQGGGGRTPSSPTPPRRRRNVDGDTLDEVDRILDKIRESGMDSLTPEESAFLHEMSRRYKKTRVH